MRRYDVTYTKSILSARISVCVHHRKYFVMVLILAWFWIATEFSLYTILLSESVTFTMKLRKELCKLYIPRMDKIG